MMPLVSAGWNVVVFVLCLAGFFFLLFANEREGRRLLHRPASRRERRICAGAGGVLLLLALWVCIQEWRGNFGSVLWFGWLTVAALAVIFTTSGDGRQKSGNRKANAPRNNAPPRHCEERSDVAIQAAVPLPETLEQMESSSTPSARTLPRANDGNRVSWEFMKRMAIRGAFVLLPCLFLLSGWRVEPWPVLRAGAVQGEVGPWVFTLAETEAAAPKIGGSGVAMKAFELRFADAAQPEIRAAYLRARKPRSLRAAGIAFEGNHLRTATIIIPPAFQAEEQLWLTVEGRNGEVHHAAVDVHQLSPALSRFLAGEEPPQESREGWNAVLTCRNEATDVICQGATFGSGETRFMDGTLIEVSDENDKPLLSARLNRKGELRFPRPDGKFHILMEEEPGQTVELNERDVGQEAEDRDQESEKKDKQSSPFFEGKAT